MTVNNPTPLHPKANRPWFKKKRFIIPIGVLAFFILIGALAGEEETTPTAGESKPAAVEKTEKPKVDAEPAKATTAAPEPKPTEKPKPKPKPLTRSQENAIRAAEGYLDYTAFSKKGLIKQLEFEKFSKADAEFAVNRIKVNWKEQAVKAAEGYLDYSSFSRDSLIQQLEFEGYTREQAEYGVSKTGL